MVVCYSALGLRHAYVFKMLGLGLYVIVPLELGTYAYLGCKAKVKVVCWSIFGFS